MHHLSFLHLEISPAHSIAGNFSKKQEGGLADHWYREETQKETGHNKSRQSLNVTVNRRADHHRTHTGRRSRITHV